MEVGLPVLVEFLANGDVRGLGKDSLEESKEGIFVVGTAWVSEKKVACVETERHPPKIVV